MYCPKCKEVGRDGNFCDICGTHTILSKFLCPDCNASNYVINRFCEHCGRPIQTEAQAFIDGQIKKGGETDENTNSEVQ